MILLIEPDSGLRKKLCDLLSNERIINVASVTSAFEMICKFRNGLDIIIANIQLLEAMLSNQTVFKLCQKLSIEAPPIVSYYKKGDEKIKAKIEKANKQHRFVEYNEKDCSFPGQYIQAIREVYPNLNADIERAREIWLKERESDKFIDPYKWLEEKGFLKDIEKAKIQKQEDGVDKKIVSKEDGSIKTADMSQKTIEEEDYKLRYFELKKKYDELLKSIKKFKNSVEEIDV